MWSPFLPMPKRVFHRHCLTGRGGKPHSSKTQFSKKLVFQRTCASTSKHSSPSYLTLEVSLPPTSKERVVNSCLGAQPLLILACTIMQMQRWCSHTLGRDPIPAFPPRPRAAYSLCSATTEDWILVNSICFHFSSDLGFASFCHWMYLLQLCVWEPLSSSFQTQ